MASWSPLFPSMKGTTTSTVIEDMGLKATFTGASAYTTGTYVNGDSYYIVANGNTVTLASVGLSDGVVTNTYIGGVMVDPGQSSALQGFDNRGLAANTYSAGLAQSLPLTVNVSGGAKTIWIYRGRDSQEGGGGNSNCFAIVQITVLASAPAANSLKPPGVYCAGGKPQKTTADINYSLFTPMTKPASAVERDWNAIGSDGSLNTNFLYRPLASFGANVNSQYIAPTAYQWSYPTYQANAVGQMLLGCLTNISDRQALINRVCQAGLEVKALVDLGYDIFRPNGGFGIGMKGLMFFAGQWLNIANMKSRPADLTPTIGGSGVDQAFFAEDGYFWENAANSRVLIGMDNNLSVSVMGDNHMWRDTSEVYDPHNLPVKTGTATAGGANTITLAVGTTGISTTYQIAITGGTGSGQSRLVSNWVAGTRVATVSVAWGTQPDNTSTYAYSNGGTYQAIIMAGVLGTATAVVLANKVSDWDRPIFFEACKQWVSEDGQWAAPNAYGEQTSNDGQRLFYDATPETWTKHYYDAAVASWPTYTYV